VRKALFDLSHLFGQTDFRNDAELATLQARAAEVVHLLLDHGHKEDIYHLPLLESRAPGSTAHDSADHVEIEKRIRELAEAFEQLGGIAAEERFAVGEELYFEYNRFISDYLVHMDEEERQTAKLFYQHCTEEELRRLEGEIVASLAPAEAAVILGYMIPSIDAATRHEWLRGIRQAAPPAAFQGVMSIAQKTLAPEAYARLEAEVG
jgi:hypothetical protein